MSSYRIFIAIVIGGIFYLSACQERSRAGGKEEAEITLTDDDYREIGLGIAKSTQTELGKNLVGAMKKEGPLGALEFCNLQAYPLTDSMALVHDVRIRRATDRPRNRDNRANDSELAHIEHFKSLVSADEEYESIVEHRNGKINFFYPIMTNAMCLQCHGKPNLQIQSETLAKILELYTEDQAIGYDVNEVRGIWSIEFDEKRGS